MALDATRVVGVPAAALVLSLPLAAQGVKPDGAYGWAIPSVAALRVETMGALEPSSALQQDGSQEVLTNASIVELHRSGFSSDLIVRKIMTAPRTNFDVSVEGLRKLKEAGVGEQVLSVMLDAADARKRSGSPSNVRDRPTSTESTGGLGESKPAVKFEPILIGDCPDDAAWIKAGGKTARPKGMKRVINATSEPRVFAEIVKRLTLVVGARDGSTQEILREYFAIRQDCDGEQHSIAPVKANVDYKGGSGFTTSAGHPMVWENAITGMKFEVHVRRNTLQFVDKSGEVIASRREAGGNDLLAFAFAGENALVEQVLLAGGDVNYRDDKGWTPVMVAAMVGKDATVQLLLNRGATADVQDHDGFTSLAWAARNGHTASVTTLIAGGADPDLPNKDGFTPLMLSAILGHVDTVRELLTSRANPYVITPNGWSALLMAQDKQQSQTVDVMVGAIRTDIQRLGDACRMRDIETIRNLIRRGVYTDFQAPDGSTPIAAAASRGHADVVELLLDSGADINAVNSFGGTALHAAAFAAQADVARLLIERGASVNVNSNGFAPLHFAVLSTLAPENSPADGPSDTDVDRAVVVFRLLLDRGADPMMKDRNGYDALRTLGTHVARGLRPGVTGRRLEQWRAMTAAIEAKAPRSAIANRAPNPSSVGGDAVVCPYTPSGHLASWAISAVTTELGRHFGGQVGSVIGSHFGLVGRLVGLSAGRAAGEIASRDLAHEMLEASHLPALESKADLLKHLESAHSANAQIARGLRAVMASYAMDREFVRSIAPALASKIMQ